MTARFLVGDVFDRMAELPDGSVDLIVTSPPFLGLRSYLPADHPDKAKEIGSEPTPAAFIDTMLRLTSEWRRLLAPHGSIAVELGDTYAGSTMGGGDDRGNERYPAGRSQARANGVKARPADGGPPAKSKSLIPELYRIALAYGIHPLTGDQSPAGAWRVRNVVTWCRPNPPVGALSDKWRPATSDIVVACMSRKRYWDDLATRKPWSENTGGMGSTIGNYHEDLKAQGVGGGNRISGGVKQDIHGGAPLLDYWEITPGGYRGSHYAVYPPALVEPLVKAMAPPRVCVECGEPSERITGQPEYVLSNGEKLVDTDDWRQRGRGGVEKGMSNGKTFRTTLKVETLGWSDCGHDAWRPGLVLDPFAGTGTTLMVATGHGLDAIGIDLDARNVELARERCGMFLEVLA